MLLKRNFRIQDFFIVIKFERYLQTLCTFFGPHRIAKSIFLTVGSWRAEIKIGGHLGAAKTAWWRHWLCTFCKILIVPEEGWFGQPKYSAHIKTSLRCVGFCIYFLQNIAGLQHLLDSLTLICDVLPPRTRAFPLSFPPRGKWNCVYLFDI